MHMKETGILNIHTIVLKGRSKDIGNAKEK